MTVYSVQGLEQEQRSYEPIPAGVYNAIVADVSFGPFNSGQGFKVDITYEITEGEYQNRKVFDMIAIQHDNMEWAQSTQARLDALLQANGVANLEDWNQLVNLQCALKVYIQKSKDPQYSDKNQVDLVLPMQGAATQPMAAPAQPTMAAPQMQQPVAQSMAVGQAGGAAPGYATGGPANPH